MSRNSEHLSSIYNSNMCLSLELSECRLRISNVINAKIAGIGFDPLLLAAFFIQLKPQGSRQNYREYVEKVDIAKSQSRSG